MRNDTKVILEAVQKGEMTVEEALLFLKKAPFEDIGYAKVDSHRAIRQGVAEVIFGAGKTAEQMIGIVEQMKKNGDCIAEGELGVRSPFPYAEYGDENEI